MDDLLQNLQAPGPVLDNSPLPLPDRKLCRRIPSCVWEYWREVIQTKYCEEKLSQADLCAYMRETYGFIATYFTSIICGLEQG